MRLLHLVVATFLATSLLGQQTAEDFTVIDTDGQIHRLYADHLDQGQTVVIKLFFVACPPCNSIASSVQDLYETWGEGEYDVEFLEITTIESDDDQDVDTYKDIHSLTFPGISADGMAAEAVLPYKTGVYGPYFGTPSFAVIAPDGSIQFSLSFSQLDAAIAATGATGGQTAPDPTSVSLDFVHPGGKSVDEQYLNAKLHPAGQTFPSYDITFLTNGSHQFNYPSPAFPTISNPTITVTSDAPAFTGGVSAVDLVKVNKHILDLIPFEHDWQLLASDLTGNATVSASDIVNLRKLILGIITELPGQQPGQIIMESSKPLLANPGQSSIIQFDVIKIGDVD